MGAPQYRCCNPDDPICVASMQTNQRFLLTWLALLPEEVADIDEDSYVRAVAARSGNDASDTRTNLRIAFQLSRMPLLRDHALKMKHLNRKWLAAIERACIAVKEEFLPQVDAEIVKLLTPRVDNQALPHWRRITLAIKKLLIKLDPPAAEPDPTQEEALHIYHPETGPSSLQVWYPQDEAYELEEIIKAAARTYNCSRADALLQLARGSAQVKVTLNLYAPATGDGPVNLGGALPLDDAAAQAWCERASISRDLGEIAESSTAAYEIPETYKAFVKGRDGGCRFPGCGAAPERCDIDHVVPFGDGGPTTPENLQCLCRRCHNLKTDRMVTAEITKDGNVRWTMPDGTAVTTTPHGPVPAKPDKIIERTSRWAVTFEERKRRRTQRRRS